jgi:FkbH-like protein
MLKLIIWDLDDTLWRGTLADGDSVAPFEQRIALVRAFNAKGVVSSICSKNDPAVAEAKLRALGWWDDFVFPSIAFVPKPEAVAGIIADMQLRAPDVLFVDDNVQNLEAVRFHLREIQLLDITAPDADATLAAMLDAQPAGKSRVEAYRSLEARKRDQGAQPELSHEDFLRSCEIRMAAPFCMENLDYVDRIAELMARSNQLNYTQSRRTAEELRAEIIEVLHQPSLSIFAWDRYGDYGLVGFVMLRGNRGEGYELVHCVFSCRVMHMGLEQAALRHIRERARDLYQPIRAIEMGAAGARLIEGPADWVAVQSYADPATRAKVAALAHAVQNPDADIRLLFGCQSGGIAHFSALRDRIAFDSYPDVFLLRSFWDGSHEAFALPRYLVYGASIDYSDHYWRNLTNMMGQGGGVDRLRTPTEDLRAHFEEGRYEICVKRFCDHVEATGRKLLVMLAPEGLPAGQYSGSDGLTLHRIRHFNNIWRRAFEIYPSVSVLDSDEAHGPGELNDLFHYSPTGIATLSMIVDTWHGMVAPERAAA